MNGFFRDLYEELKRRRVIRAATLYVVFLWPVIQIVDILAPALELPNALMQILLVIFIAGFPVVVVVAWGFNLTPGGLVRVSGSEDDERFLLGRRTELSIIVVLLVVGGSLYFVQDRLELFLAPAASDSRESPQIAQAAVTDPHTIAVLPFLHFSPDPQDQFFADGLTEELLNVLSRVKALRVAARTSSFSYRGVSKKVEEIGRELKVRYILEGSVRRNDVDDTVRVTAQLIDVDSGTHLWSETFDRQYRDIFKIQDEISAAVVDRLQVTLLAGEEDQIKSHASASPAAMVANSMGHTEMARRTAQSLADAIRYFKKAIAEDPAYPEAWSGLADAYTLVANYRYGPKEENLRLAQEAVDEALALAPDLGTAVASQGLIYMNQDREEEAREAMKRAIELSPSYAMAHMWYGSLCDDVAEQMEHLKRAYELDPRSPVAGYNYADTLISQGRESEAMEVFSSIVNADPLYPLAYLLVARINQFRGRLDEAVVNFRRSYELQPNWNVAAQIASTYFDLGDFEPGNRWVETAANDAPEDEQLQISWLRATSHLARNEQEQAFQEIRPLLAVTEPGDRTYLSAALAAYFLGDHGKAIGAYERVSEKAASENAIKDLYIDGSIAAAYAYKALGRGDEADALLEALVVELDRLFAMMPRLHPDFWYRRALIEAIRDNRQIALLNLQRALDEGWSQKWRPAIEPALAPIVRDGNFQLMMAGLEARMNLMREQLAFEESMGDDWRG